jgi:dTDP-4-amino-4,6-dideoxygalactose transaminase
MNQNALGINSSYRGFARLKWCPPAESHLPLKALREGFGNNRHTAEICLREYTRTAHCLIGPSARALLHSLLVTLSKTTDSQRREILVPGYTCYSVAASVVKAGLKIRFYDLAPKTFSPVLSSVANACGKNTLAIISQHLLGIPTDVRDICCIAREVGAYHIEDAAQSLGGGLKNACIGASADFGLLSFGRGKPLPLGGGGAIVSNRWVLSELLSPFAADLGLIRLAITTITQIAAHPYVYGLIEKLPLGLGKTEFNPDFETGIIPLSLINLIPATMAYLPEMNRRRRKIAAIYQHIIHPAGLIEVPDRGCPIYPRFPVLARPGRLPIELLRLGVRRLYPKALHQEPQIKAHAATAIPPLPGVETLAQRLITLPTHHAIKTGTAVIIGHRINQWIGQSPQYDK